MDAALLIARLVLAAAFAVAAIAKLRDRSGTREAVAEFGVPRQLAGPFAAALPIAELGLVGSLAVEATAAAGAVVALGLLLAFAVAIAWNLAHGRAPDCHCFGALHSSQSSLRTVARNLALATVAGFVAAQLGQATLVAGTASVAAAVLAPLTIAAWRRARTEASAGEGLPVGAPAPEFRLPARQGLSVTLDSLRSRGLPVLLLFTDEHCGPCIELAPEVARWQRQHTDELTIAVIEHARDGVRPPDADEHGRINVLLQHDGKVAHLYRALGTPTAVLVSVDGAVASPAAPGAAAIEALVAHNVPNLRARPAPRRRAERMPSATALGRPLARRELLIRGAGAWATVSAVLTSPLRAVAGIASRRPKRSVEPEPCGDQRCGNGARCGEGRRGKKRCACANSADRRCRNRGVIECQNVDSNNPGPGEFVDGPQHCGGCNRPPCGDDEVCAGGKCVSGNFDPDACECGGFIGTCGPTHGRSLSECRARICCINANNGYRCVDPNRDELHCGGCNQACAEGKSPKCCRGHCVDTHGDPRNCGGCEGDYSEPRRGKPCGRRQLCYEGRCIDKCPEGRSECRTGRLRTCHDPDKELCCEDGVISQEDAQSDIRNCGQCGRTCDGPFDTGECCAGECCDYNAQTCCPGGCKNTSLDDANCGACGRVCRPGEYCRFGDCVCPLGNTCG